MNQVKVKICGVRSVAVARTAALAGADFIGLNFVSTSKRRIDLALAQEIVKAVKGKTLVVGIFQDQPLEEVNSIASRLGLDFVQLHGVEDGSYMQQIKTPIIKSFAFTPGFDVSKTAEKLNTSKAKYILLDRPIQGEGDAVNINSLLKLTAHLRKEYFLAGGLTSENVEAKVGLLKPFAVDVAGGIETNRQEDIMKIKQFIHQAKEASNV